MKEGQPVPRTKQPELKRTSLTMEQINRLHDYDVFIDNLKIEKPISLKERWQAIDRKMIEDRNKRIGWNPNRRSQ